MHSKCRIISNEKNTDDYFKVEIFKKYYAYSIYSILDFDKIEASEDALKILPHHGEGKIGQSILI